MQVSPANRPISYAIRCLITSALWFEASYTSASAFEPVRVNATQASIVANVPKIDHLLPLEQTLSPIPEFAYLVQYWGRVSNERYHYVVVMRNDRDGRFYVKTGDPPRQKIPGRKFRFKNQAEISAATALLIYEYWVNMLLETHYGRGQLPHMSAASIYIFSTSIDGAGWLHGYTLYPGVSENVPPYWMCQAGEALFEFVNMSHDEVELQKLIRKYRDKYYEYRRPNAPTKPTESKNGG